MSPFPNHLDIIGIGVLCPSCSWILLLAGPEARHAQQAGWRSQCPLMRPQPDAI